ncbi:hypothetical protein M407DRAFT_11416 [Tulasnella calospora MUT 4182]|uniref:Uncharacterized protein n=1 Tax=Tulasnella calospora MUT 4182 TaxID=1051891 RepID=A0A0C3KDA5_9AGAM|nr:hypothetical protein M407DRAFT_11416 [Tulasnella calospora MUT 4182]
MLSQHDTEPSSREESQSPSAALSDFLEKIDKGQGNDSEWVEKQLHEWMGSIIADSHEGHHSTIPLLEAIPNGLRKTVALLTWMKDTAKKNGLPVKEIKNQELYVRESSLDRRFRVSWGQIWATTLIKTYVSAHMDSLCKDVVLDFYGSDLSKEAGCSGMIRNFLHCNRCIALEVDDCVLILPERSLDIQGREAATILCNDGDVKSCTLLTGAVDYCIATWQAGISVSGNPIYLLDDQVTVSDTMQTDANWPFSESVEQYYISLVEAKRVSDRGKPVRLEDHLPQVIAQCIVTSRAIRIGSKHESELSPVPFILSNGIDWIFGVVGNAPPSGDTWCCLHSEIQRAEIPTIKGMTFDEVCKVQYTPSIKAIVEAILAWTCSQAPSIFDAMMLEGSLEDADDAGA